MENNGLNGALESIAGLGGLGLSLKGLSGTNSNLAKTLLTLSALASSAMAGYGGLKLLKKDGESSALEENLIKAYADRKRYGMVDPTEAAKTLNELLSRISMPDMMNKTSKWESGYGSELTNATQKFDSADDMYAKLYGMGSSKPKKMPEPKKDVVKPAITDGKIIPKGNKDFGYIVDPSSGKPMETQKALAKSTNKSFGYIVDTETGKPMEDLNKDVLIAKSSTFLALEKLAKTQGFENLVQKITTGTTPIAPDVVTDKDVKKSNSPVDLSFKEMKQGNPMTGAGYPQWDFYPKSDKARMLALIHNTMPTTQLTDPNSGYEQKTMRSNSPAASTQWRGRFV